MPSGVAARRFDSERGASNDQTHAFRLALEVEDRHVPSCYFLSVCAGSSVDQRSNNVTLFNLVEQIHVPPGAPPPPKGIIPLEVHAYFDIFPEELGLTFELRFVMIAPSGLETPSDVLKHKPATPRYRTRTLGLP